MWATGRTYKDRFAISKAMSNQVAGSMRGTKFLWQAAGCPPPTETDGTPILPRDLRAEAERERRRLRKQIDAVRAVGDSAAVESLERTLATVVDDPYCASCGGAASHRFDDAISDNFTTVKNAHRAWPFGGRHVCAACLWCCKTLALRCAGFFARPDRIWFFALRPIPGVPSTRPDPLDVLLHPPDPPFVAGLPLYGIDHGGEANLHRAIWPWAGNAPHAAVRAYDGGARLFVPTNPLIKLQSKHTALYAEVSLSRGRYRLQVDDTGDVTVDVPLWTRLRIVCGELLDEMRRAGVGAQEAREALITLRPPRGYLIRTAMWHERVEPMRPHVGAAWWGLFTTLLPMPDLPAKTTKPAPIANRRPHVTP